MIDKAGISGAAQILTGPSFERGVRGVGSGLSRPDVAGGLEGFGDFIKNGVDKVNTSVVDFEKTTEQFASGEKVNIHELMVKGEQATMSLQLMMAVRNKVVEAYQEVMRMPV